MMVYKKILVAVDSSAASLTDAEYGFALAHQLKASIGLLYVVDKSKEITSADLATTPAENENILVKRAEETISQLSRMYSDVEDALHFTPEGFPKEEIVKTARDWGADLIIMGTGSHDGLSRLFSDGIAEHVINHSAIPVMLIPKR